MSGQSTAILTRAQHRVNAQTASAAAAIAQAAAAAVVPHPALSGAGGNSGDAAVQMLAQLLQQQALQAKADQAERVAARFEAALAAAEALAQQRRAGAGPPPLFRGQSRDIAVHTWLIALERWFENAHIDAVGADVERIEVASSALRDTAQTWWAAALAADAAATAAGNPSSFQTWANFTAAARKHFLPQSPELWAFQQLETLTSSGMRDVAMYTSKFVELDMLLSDQATGSIARVVCYQRGLPESYRVRCAEKQHSTLAAAMETTLALWNAKSAALHQSARPAKLNNTQIDESGDDESTSDSSQPQPQASTASSSSSSSKSAVAKLEQKLDAFISAMQMQGSRDHRRDNGGSRGRGRDRQQEGAPRSARSRTPGVSEELAKQRLQARVCIKCAEPGHYARDCTNALKTN